LGSDFPITYGLSIHLSNLSIHNFKHLISQRGSGVDHWRSNDAQMNTNPENIVSPKGLIDLVQSIVWTEIKNEKYHLRKTIALGWGLGKASLKKLVLSWDLVQGAEMTFLGSGRAF
jgi:hypothetical protein